MHISETKNPEYFKNVFKNSSTKVGGEETASVLPTFNHLMASIWQSNIQANSCAILSRKWSFFADFKYGNWKFRQIYS